MASVATWEVDGAKADVLPERGLPLSIAGSAGTWPKADVLPERGLPVSTARSAGTCPESALGLLRP